jgi:GTP-binding protein Era
MTKAGFISIIGKPNAGKSTLMNSIIGSKLSIVTHKPQTTRKKVLGIYSTESTQIIFYDTPGILKPKYELQRSMMDYVRESLEGTDAVALIMDIEEYRRNKDFPGPAVTEMLKGIRVPVILVINKIDKLSNIKEILPMMAEISSKGIFREIVPISALRKGNIAELIKVFESFLPESDFYYDPEQLSTQPERFFISEIIRERIFLEYKQELPYSAEVQIAEFKERETGKWYIAADIIIERSTQKQIIIGEGGQKIKIVGSLARKDIEDHLQMPVYLDLFVKVRDNWRDNKGYLKSLGY